MTHLNQMKNKFREAYEKINTSCLGAFHSSSLLDAKCVQIAYDDIANIDKKYFLHYLEGQIIRYDIIAFSAYAILDNDKFIGISDLVDNDLLDKEFDQLHSDETSIEETLLELNAQHILNGGNMTAIELIQFIMDNECIC